MGIGIVADRTPAVNMLPMQNAEVEKSDRTLWERVTPSIILI
ncbi:hypothetical protein OSCI_860029 [Kamptonema sp. PCC 6506]|nr:hypothetical protein OSCI_860029 [Kamptonema sp. PCC 6506]